MNDDDDINQTMLFSLAAIYIGMTEAIHATFGRSVEPMANQLIRDMLPQMPAEAADICRKLITYAGSSAPISHETITLTDRDVLH